MIRLSKLITILSIYIIKITILIRITVGVEHVIVIHIEELLIIAHHAIGGIIVILKEVLHRISLIVEHHIIIVIISHETSHILIIS